MKGGLIQRQMPPYLWDERPLKTWLRHSIPASPAEYASWRREKSIRFFFKDLPQVQQPPIDEADAILAGNWRYFEGQEFSVGFPPNWHFNPVSQKMLSHDKHWSQISDFGAGDIKYVWEPNRFSVTYALVRAYAAAHDERYAEAFWQLIEDWSEKNPPQTGPNWKCGQETTFRVMAWCFGLYGFAKSPSTTPERLAHLAAMIAAQAERIAGNFNYARSQKNNHGISEAVGLWTVGLLFPEFSQAEMWLEQGKKMLLEEMRRQIYPGGAYVQHSLNYHRVMLHDSLWALRLSEINDSKLPDEIYEQFHKAVDFLHTLVDPQSGQVPNYGSNDGALVLPLNSCDYTDYRPVVQAGNYLLHRSLVYPPGPWDEDIVWLFGNNALQSLTTPTATPANLASDGYYLLHGDQSRIMIRCGEYQDRPAHADQLHIDLWWRGINIACDAGTYLYNGTPPWNNGLSATSVHNTVSVDDQNQMTRAGLFLWLDWAQGRVTRREDFGLFILWEGEHNGYQRLAAPVCHRRGVIQLPNDTWLVYDSLNSIESHSYQLHWLLPDYPYQQTNGGIELRTPAGFYNIRVLDLGEEGQHDFVRADKETVRGWRSQYYGVKEPALSLSVTHREVSCRFITVFSPSGSCGVFQSGNILRLENAGWWAEIDKNGGKILPNNGDTYPLEFVF